MKERLKLQEEVADAALKEVDHTIALNTSKIDISPSKVATSEEVKERKSMPLWQIIDATLPDNSAGKNNGQVASLNTTMIAM